MISGLPPRYLWKEMPLQWWSWFQSVYQSLAGGQTVVITTAKLTNTGTEGSMTFTNGLLTKSTAAT